MGKTSKFQWRPVASWIAFAFALMIVTTGIIACSVAPEEATSRGVPNEDDAIKYTVDHQVRLKDGRTVTCLFYDPPSMSNGALDCDWANAK